MNPNHESAMRRLIFIFTALTAGACASAPRTPAPPPNASELEALYHARLDSARTRFTEADIEFMTGMIHHHAQAIEMAQLVPERTTATALNILAARIINAQQDEIATMQRWLRDRAQPVPELHVMDGRVMVMAPGEHGEHGAHMPGMLSPAQMEQLRAATGAAFERLFLEYMIQHHKGAVLMVHTLFATDGAGQDEDAFRVASDVQVDQQTEIARMESMLAELNED